MALSPRQAGGVPTKAKAAGRSKRKLTVFVSYNTLDRDPVRMVVRELESRGIGVMWDQGGFAAGQFWLPELERMLKSACDAVVLCLGPSGMGYWQYNEMGLAFDRKRAEPEFPVIPILLPKSQPGGLVLGMLTWIDLREGIHDEARIQALLAACYRQQLKDREQRQSDLVKESIMPFRGLLRFREEDAALFFGREAFVGRIEELTKRSKLVAIVGPSGSGKSSIAHAGLFSRLRNERWRILWMVPSDRPVRNLASALIQALHRESAPDPIEVIRKANSLADDLRTQTITLRDVIDQMSSGATEGRILLLIDQWEELYTLAPAEERAYFLEQLFSVLDAGRELPLTVVLTLRADFYGHALSERRLSDLIQSGLVNLGPMTAQELREAIEKPASTLGFEFDDGLVDQILDDVEDEPGSLPLVEFLLEQLWLRREGRRFTRTAYDELDGVKGAIAHVAEATWAQLNDEQRRIVTVVFARLVQVKLGEQATRRRAPMRELSDEQRRVVRKLVDSRILVTARNASTNEEFLDVAHEALLRHWKRLEAWLQEHREFLLWHQRLEFVLQDWKDGKQDVSLLLMGPRVEEAMRWLEERPDFLVEDEKQFIRASRDRSDYLKQGETLRLEVSRNLADATLLDEFSRKSDTLWPPYPEHTGELEALIAEVQQAVAKIPRKQELLEQLDRRLQDEQSPHLRWQRDQLELLLTNFRALENPDAGVLQSLRRRLDTAQTIHDRSIGTHSREWEDAIRWIESQRVYAGLKLRPQLGLLPLGPDRSTGMMEFLHLLSHTGDIPTRNHAGAIPLTENCGVILVLLPGGAFTMGAQAKDGRIPNFDPRAEDNESPPHRIELGAFFLAKYLVTQSQWLRMTGRNPSRYRPGVRDARGVVSLLHPVEEISWAQSQRELQRVGLLLPTEAQWEYTARAGQREDPVTGFDAPFPGIELLTQQAHADESSEYKKVHAPVGTYAPNAHGIYDMLGNVWELTRDFSDSYSVAPDLGDGWRGKKGEYVVLRGGSYFNSLSQLRVTWRTDDATIDKAAAWLGVRAARACLP
jgi:formylglycine-generating enzyme required for sulfatase activity